MPSQKAYDKPTVVEAIDGEVTLNGPDGIGLSMTADAAEETGRRLIAAAKLAKRQAPARDEREDEPQPPRDPVGFRRQPG